jgi:predicted metal-dependent phosphoesterase TrpH
MPELCQSGLNAIEAYHSDHTPQDTQLYLGLASHYGLRVTGGSDYHGAIKPNVTFGSLRVPDDLLDRLR